ncbi:MAG: hypothetical protein Q9220_005690 [cf. Caloplaca sp. 1 TL-2023]
MLPRDILRHPRRKTPLLMILVSPVYTRLLNDGVPFVPDLLRQIYLYLETGQAVDVVVAVVDGISFPARHANYHSEAEAHKTNTEYTRNGISCILLETENAAPDLWSTVSQGDNEHVSTTQQRSTLSFQFAAPISESYSSKVFTLPVANTIFQNGRESTIQAQRWAVGEQSEQSEQPSLDCVKRVWLKKLQVKVDYSEREKFLRKPFHVSIPLQPITAPRKVAASMGNVVRQVYTDDSSEGAVPASKELEGAVVKWIADQGLEMQTVEVWALVIPQTIQLAEAPSMVGTLIDGGSHLHKVLSGGGGWGKKQGLLALDPESEFNINQETKSHEDLLHEAPEVERSRNLGQIISPGDNIQFFVRSSKAASPGGPETSRSMGSSYVFNNDTSFVFGTTPSSIDSMTIPKDLEMDDVASSPCIVSQRHFGMLSEQGMSLTTVNADGQTLQTKIDVPYATISSGVSDRLPPMQRLENRIKRASYASKAPNPEPRIRKITPTSSWNMQGNEDNYNTPKPGFVSDIGTRDVFRDPKVMAPKAASPPPQWVTPDIDVLEANPIARIRKYVSNPEMIQRATSSPGRLS